MVAGRLWVIIFLKVGSALPKRPSIMKVILAVTTALVLATALRIIAHLFYLEVWKNFLVSNHDPIPE